MQWNLLIIDSLSCILDIMWLVDLSLILFNNFRGIYSKYIHNTYSKYAAKFLSINDETQWVPLLFVLSRFITFAPSFILGKQFLEKMSLNLGS